MLRLTFWCHGNKYSFLPHCGEDFSLYDLKNNVWYLFFLRMYTTHLLFFKCFLLTLRWASALQTVSPLKACFMISAWPTLSCSTASQHKVFTIVLPLFDQLSDQCLTQINMFVCPTSWLSEFTILAQLQLPGLPTILTTAPPITSAWKGPVQGLFPDLSSYSLF